MKTLDVTDCSKAAEKIKDIKFFGDGDRFSLLCKASSESEGWMKSTKAMEIEGIGCVVQVTTQQRNDPRGRPVKEISYVVAEAVCFVPHVKIMEIKDEEGEVVGRALVDIMDAFQQENEAPAGAQESPAVPEEE